MDGKIKENDQRDFLGEAARLALQLDPLAWEFDLSDRQSQVPYHTAGVPEGVPLSLLQGGRASNREAPTTAPWENQQTAPYAAQIVQAPPSMQPSSPFEIGDTNNLRMLGPRFYEHAAGGSVPSRLSRESLKHRSATEPMFLDQLDQSKSSWNPSQLSALNSWHFAQNMSGWADGIKAEPAQNDDDSEAAALRAELAKLQKEKDQLESHTKILESALMKVAKQEQAKEPQDFVPSRGWTSFDPKATVVIDTLFSPPKRISADDAAHLPLREYAMLWRSYLGEVKDLLKDCRQDSTAYYSGNLTPAEEKLRALLTERHGFLVWVAANNPSICHCLLTMDMGSDPPQKIQDGLTPERTREIMEKMVLTENQSSFLLEARNQFLLSMGYYSAALFKLQQQLSDLDPNPKESVRNCHFLNWLHVARSLQETVEEMHVCGITFHCKLYKLKSGITPYQAAVLMIESFPYLPDVVALVSEVAVTKGAPEAQDLFKLGRERYLANPAASELKFVREPHPSANSRIGKIASLLQRWESGRH